MDAGLGACQSGHGHLGRGYGNGRRDRVRHDRSGSGSDLPLLGDIGSEVMEWMCKILGLMSSPAGVPPQPTWLGSDRNTTSRSEERVPIRFHKLSHCMAKIRSLKIPGNYLSAD